MTPTHATCPDCGTNVLLVKSENGEHDLLVDPEPVHEADGEGRCIVFLRRGVATSAIYEDVTGRFDTYRGHPWSCPSRRGGS